MATRRVDDSDEGEATALDLRPSSRSARVPADGPSQPRAPAPPKAPPAPASRRPILADSSEDDEDATEFLAVRPPSRGPARSPSTEAVPRAQGRAVPIEAESSSSPSPPAQAPLPPTPLPPSPLPAAIAPPLPPPSTDAIRPLPHRTIASDASATGTASVPRVTRIHIVARQSTTNGDHDEVPESTADIDPETTIPPQLLVKAPPPPPPRVPTKVESRDDETQAGGDPDETQAPSQQAPSDPPAPLPHRRLPTSAEGDALPARRSAARPSEVHDGVLVVDAPPEATVTVNGVERGRGTVRVGDLDREARHAVRIHCAGFAPWSGSVSLQGKPAAKIRPALKPRAR